MHSKTRLFCAYSTTVYAILVERMAIDCTWDSSQLPSLDCEPAQLCSLVIEIYRLPYSLESKYSLLLYCHFVHIGNDLRSYAFRHGNYVVGLRAVIAAEIRSSRKLSFGTRIEAYRGDRLRGRLQGLVDVCHGYVRAASRPDMQSMYICALNARFVTSIVAVRPLCMS
jgi:hypothetical protein